MHRFRTTLTPGVRPPYDTWTFLVIPPDLASRWGSGRKAVRGTLAGTPFRGTVSRGEGVLRMPVPRDLRREAGVGLGDTVEVTIELDTEPRPIALPDELRAAFEEDPELGELFARLPPSLRRAWATYVAEAKQPPTRLRRARKSAHGIRAREYPR